MKPPSFFFHTPLLRLMQVRVRHGSSPLGGRDFFSKEQPFLPPVFIFRPLLPRSSEDPHMQKFHLPCPRGIFLYRVFFFIDGVFFSFLIAFLPRAQWPLSLFSLIVKLFYHIKVKSLRCLCEPNQFFDNAWPFPLLVKISLLSSCWFFQCVSESFFSPIAEGIFFPLTDCVLLSHRRCGKRRLFFLSHSHPFFLEITSPSSYALTFFSRPRIFVTQRRELFFHLPFIRAFFII